MKRFLFAYLLLIVLVGGCTMAQREGGAVIADGARGVLTTAAGATAGTPLAPILLALGVGAGIVAKLLRNAPKQEEEVETELKVGRIAAPGFFGSRKNKLTAIGFIVAGLVTFAKIQWDLPESVCVALLGLVTIVTGVNINGIAKEDAAEKSNGNGS